MYDGERVSGSSDFFGDGKLRRRMVFERNASGLVVKETMFVGGGKVTSVEEVTYEHHP